MTDIWKSDIRWDDGTSEDVYTSKNSADAVAHFRKLLARDDLIGKPCAARLVSPVTWRAIYSSRFDREFGDGRIHPDFPVNVTLKTNGTPSATKWFPVTDWLNEDVPFELLLKNWGKSHGLSREQQAIALGVPVRTIANWHNGRKSSAELIARKLMAAYSAGYRPDDWPKN